MTKSVESRDSHRAQIERMEADIRKLTRRAAGDMSDDESRKKKPKKSFLEEELAKYSKNRGLHSKKGKDAKKKDESDVLAAMASFRNKLQGTMQVDEDDDSGKRGESGEPMEGVEGHGGGEEEGIEVDNDYGFMSHALRFPKGNEEEVDKAEREYEVIDPRARGAQAREEERERKRLQEKKRPKFGAGGGGGRRRDDGERRYAGGRDDRREHGGRGDYSRDDRARR